MVEAIFILSSIHIVQTEQTEAVQITPTDNLLAQASLNTYSKNRGLTRRLREERRRARKQRQLEKQKQKQLQRQQKHQEKMNKPRKQKMKNRGGRNNSGIYAFSYHIYTVVSL